MMIREEYIHAMHQIAAVTGESYLSIEHAIVQHGGAIGSRYTTTAATDIVKEMVTVALRYATYGKTVDQIVMMLEAFADGWVAATEQAMSYKAQRLLDY